MDDLPIDVLEEIFLRLCIETLNQASLVSKSWKNIISSKIFWKRKLKELNIHLPSYVLENETLDNNFFKTLVKCHFQKGTIPFDINLLRNGSGELETEEQQLNEANRNSEDFDEYFYKNWKTLSSGGLGWKLYRSESHDESYFATSYISCTKLQVLDLLEIGLSPEIMDRYQPHIYVEDTYSKCRDHGAVYELYTSIGDQRWPGTPIVEHKVRHDMTRDDDDGWRTVRHEFSNYGSGIRFINVLHGGCCEDMDEGWFGVKVKNTKVVIKYPQN